MTVETVLQEVGTWSASEQLRLAVMLIEQAQSNVSPQLDRRAAFKRARGRFKHILPTVAEFQVEKQRELALEEQRYQERFGQPQEQAR